AQRRRDAHLLVVRLVELGLGVARGRLVLVDADDEHVAEPARAVVLEQAPPVGGVQAPAGGLDLRGEIALVVGALLGLVGCNVGRAGAQRDEHEHERGVLHRSPSTMSVCASARRPLTSSPDAVRATVASPGRAARSSVPRVDTTTPPRLATTSTPVPRAMGGGPATMILVTTSPARMSRIAGEPTRTCGSTSQAPPSVDGRRSRATSAAATGSPARSARRATTTSRTGAMSSWAQPCPTIFSFW